jgi:hypothetical protein
VCNDGWKGLGDGGFAKGKNRALSSVLTVIVQDILWSIAVHSVVSFFLSSFLRVCRLCISTSPQRLGLAHPRSPLQISSYAGHSRASRDGSLAPKIQLKNLLSVEWLSPSLSEINTSGYLLACLPTPFSFGVTFAQS